jgi:NADPH:quinone reductase-like Zn-dependent oxidoreductase
VQARLLTRFTDHTIKMFLSSPGREHLETLAGLVELGKLTPPIGQTHPLERAAAALSEIERGHAQGKLVIAVPG